VTYLLASALVGALALVAYLVVKVVSGKESQLADREKRLESDERADHALADRDLAVVQLAAERAKTSDLMLAKSQVESERNALDRKVRDLEVKLAATLPVGDDGAAVVNDQLSAPILGDALEKP
jgi:hypothetical protein